MSGQYAPWVVQGVSEVDYWKSVYIEARKELSETKQRLEESLKISTDNAVLLQETSEKLAVATEVTEILEWAIKQALATPMIGELAKSLLVPALERANKIRSEKAQEEA